MKHVEIENNGETVSCYGEIADNSNFYVICEDENDDGVWANGNPNNTEGTFTDWKQVVETLQPHFDSTIIEIQEI